MSTSAEGIDVSAFQLDLTVHDLSGLHFAFTKASDGISETDPNFTHNWAAIRQAGKHRGAYHELQAGLGAGQAAHFLAVVQAQGLEPGDMLAVVASDYPGVTDQEVLVFCEAVDQATHGHNPVLCYTDLSVGATLTRTSAAYPAWVAWPAVTSPPMPLAGWRKWHLWQWGTRLVPGLGQVDANGFNGTPAQMDAWIAGFKPKPPPKPKPAPLTLQGDGMLIPANFTETISLMPPQAVLLASGATVSPSVLRLSSASPAAFEYALGNTEPANWQTGGLDFVQSPKEVPITDSGGNPCAVLKIKFTANAAPVSGDFA